MIRHLLITVTARFASMARHKKILNLVGPKVRQARNKLGLTQEELAAKCQLFGLDISRGTLSQIEAQIRCVVDSELWALAQVLRAPLESLYPPGMKRTRRR